MSCELLPNPVDALAPRIAYRAARATERHGPLRRLFGTQQVILALKERADPH